MTEKKVSCTDKYVKIIADAVKKLGSIPNLHKELLRVGVNISLTALYNAEAGVAKSLKPHIIVAIAHIIYNGDGAKVLKALENDFMPPGLK